MTKVATTGEVAQRFRVSKADQRRLRSCGDLGYNHVKGTAPHRGAYLSPLRTGHHALEDDHTDSVAVELVQRAQASWLPLPSCQLSPLEPTGRARMASGATALCPRLIAVPGSQERLIASSGPLLHRSVRGYRDTSFAPGK